MDDQVRNFGLYDQEGDFHRMYYYDDAKAVVLFVQGNGCPIVRKSLNRFQDLAAEYSEKGVLFFMINSNLQDSRESVKEEADAFGIELPVLIDEDQLVADLLDIRITAESFVLDPKDWKIKYRGPMDDKMGYEAERASVKEPFLANALDKMLDGESIEEPYIAAKGCAVSRMKDRESYTELTYTDDIAPILRDNCVKCHQEGGIAPWPMNGYPMVAGWSAMMREVLMTQRMPPWQADPHYGVFKNDISIDQDELRKIVAWINGGVKKGDGEDILASLPPTAQEWKMGEPDFILELDQEDIPANGIIDYRYQTHSMAFDEDVFVKAYEVKPGNNAVLHHVLASVEYPSGMELPFERPRGEWLDGILIGWAPGGEPEEFPQGSGRRVPAGSKIHYQLHYTTSGKEETDKTRIGFYFHEDRPEKEFVVMGPANFEFEILPGIKDLPVVANEPINRAINLYAMLPHMHYRGKSMYYVAHYPDGTQEILLSVANYNFNWQRFYYLDEPKYLPVGTTLTVNAVFDNSTQNQFNPDPSKTIYFGEQTFDEMMIGYMSFTYEDETGVSSL